MGNHLKQTISVISGSVLQWYDFALFGTLAPLIANEFFPHGAFYKNLLSTYLVFFVSFLLVPVGAVIYGYIGDHYGRRQALRYSIVLMTIPTFLIGITPGYSHWGILSVIIVVFCRLLQGFSVSPEFSNSAIYLVEMAPRHAKSFYGCLTSSAYSFGFMLGGYIASFFSSLAIPYAWRVPFLFSVLGAALVTYMRKNLPESQLKVCTRQQVGCLSLQNLRSCLPVFGVAGMQGIFAYGGYVWMISFIYLQKKLSLSQAILIVSIAMLLDAVLEPIIAIFADKYGKKSISSIGIIAFAIWIFPCLTLVMQGEFISTLMAMLVLSACIATACCSLNALCVMSFDPQIRCRSFSVSFNSAISLFGGGSPLILTLLGTTTAIASYFIIACVIGIISLKAINHVE